MQRLTLIRRKKQNFNRKSYQTLRRNQNLIKKIIKIQLNKQKLNQR